MTDNSGTKSGKRPRAGVGEESKGRFMARQTLNIAFILGVLALIVMYFVRPGIKDETGYIVFGMVIVLMKIGERIIRHLPR